jgi:SulP family sulfate permease
VTVTAWLAKELGGERLSTRLLAEAETLTLDKGAVLFQQGDAADALYFVQEGRLAIVMSTEEGAHVRLRTMATHTVLGEMGLYRDLQRTATVTALEPSRVLRLTREKFLALKAVDPELCDAVHRMVVRTLSDRLAFANSAVAALQ